MTTALVQRTTRDYGEISRRWSISLLAATAALSAGAAGIALTNDHLELRGVAACAAVVVIALPVVVGLHLLRRRTAQRFAWLLIGIGLAWALTTPSLSDSDLPYTLGRIAGWGVQALIICVLLAFPSGRLESTASRVLAATALVLVAALYVPSVFFLPDFPEPAPWSPCTADCPANPLVVAELNASAAGAFEVGRDVLASGLFIATAVALAHRVRHARALTRSLWLPALSMAVASLLLLVVVFAMRTLKADGESIAAVALAGALAVPVLAVGFLIGIVRFDARTGHALASVNNQLHRANTLPELERLLAASLQDPDLRLYLSDDPSAGQWRDTTGRPTPVPAAGNSATSLVVRPDEGIPAAMLVCDRSLATSNGFLEAIGACIAEWLERQRLTSELRSSLREADASRARLAAAADTERRRIERDLHDGAQQRLIALRIRLELAEELMDADPLEAHAALHSLGPSIDEVIDDVRALSHGIYPSLLNDGGAAEALRSAATEAMLDVRVDAEGFGRHPPEIESAIYFCCLEALQNAAKHAGASHVRIGLAANGDALTFEVSDDGRGLPDDGAVHSGRGLLNIRDRVAAVGGRVDIGSPDGGGVVVRGTIPRARPAAAEIDPA